MASYTCYVSTSGNLTKDSHFEQGNKNQAVGYRNLMCTCNTMTWYLACSDCQSSGGSVNGGYLNEFHGTLKHVSRFQGHCGYPCLAVNVFTGHDSRSVQGVECFHEWSNSGPHAF